MEVVFHISCSWVKRRLYTENQLPRVAESGGNVIIPGVVWWCGVVFLTDYKTTPGDFVLG